MTFTQAVVKRIAACAHKSAVLLSGSAVGYYGDHRDSDIPLSESASAGTDFPALVCGLGGRACPRTCCAPIQVSATVVTDGLLQAAGANAPSKNFFKFLIAKQDESRL